jgi:nucleotide-binding universal stress UspA family protein
MKPPAKPTSPAPVRLRRPRLNRILVPTDLSRPAAQALRYAVPLARQVDGRITLLHVLEWPVVPAKVGALMTDEARLTRGAEQAMADLAHATVPRELLGRLVVRVGRSYEEISRAARDLKMDLIVQATHGRTGVRRMLLGSTAERVVRHAPCPVLTVPRRSAKPPPVRGAADLAREVNRILVPVDFSPAAKAAVRYAAGLARLLEARLALLHVLEPLPVSFADFPDELAQLNAVTQADARAQLARLAATVPAGIPTEQCLRQDPPREGITAMAREWRSDLIVLPTRGLTGLKYIVLGSTAEAVVRHAPCPVLTLGQT